MSAKYPKAETDPVAEADLTTHAAKTQTVRVNAGALGSGAVADITVTFPVAFADTNYTVSAVVVENISTGSNGALIRQVRAKTTTTCTVRISSSTTNFTSGQLTLEVTAIHD